MHRYKTNLFILFVVLIFTSCQDFPTPDFSKGFIKYYGGMASDVSEIVKPTSDGGFIVIGSSDSYGSSPDILVIKVDKFGNDQWQKSMGGTGSDAGTNILETSDGFVLVGKVEVNNVSFLYVAKIAKNGDSIWTKALKPDLLNYKNAFAYDIKPTLDNNGFLIAGKIFDNTNQIEKAILVNIDNQGDIIGKTFEPYGYLQQNVNSYVVYERKVGGKSVYDFLGNAIKKNAFDLNDYSLIVVSLNEVGNVRDALLKNDPRLAQPEIQTGYEMKKTSNGYIIVGSSINSIKNEDVFLLNITENFEKIWYKTYDLGKSDVAITIAITQDGGYVVGGRSVQQNKNDADAFIMKISSDGRQEWHKYYGSNNADYATSVIQTQDGGYLILCTFGLSTSSGEPDNTITLIKTDSKGEISSK